MASKGHPKAVYFISTVIAWERFSYYGMRAILVLFLVGFLKLSVKSTGNLYGWFTGFAYLTPVIGGYIADRYWGTLKTAIIGSWISVIGQFLMCLVAFKYANAAIGITILYAALWIIIIGTGLFKAPSSSMLGEFYEPNDPLCDGGFTILYMGVNIGAFFSPLICGYLGENVGWVWGFFASGTGMLIGALLLLWGKKKYLDGKGLCTFKTSKKDGSVASTCQSNAPLTKEEIQKLAVICIITFFSIFFWAAFEQAGSSLTLFAENSTNRMISFLNFEVPASWFQSLNPLIIFLLAPLFSNIWLKMAERKIEPSTPAKFVWSLFLVAAGFVLMIFGAFFCKIYGSVSMLWLVGAYFLHTLGELCSSPVGMSMVTKLSPLRFVSLMMGIYLGSSFFANIVAGVFAGNYDSMDHGVFFTIPVIISGVSGLVLLAIIRPLKRWMHGVN